MRKLLLTMALGAALTGCNKGPSTEESARATGDIRLENASAEEVIKQAAAAQGKNQIQPGEWENSVQVVAMEMPGLPEAFRKKMEDETKAPTVKKECKTAADAKAVDFAKLAPVAQGCTFAKYVLSGGKVEADMVCKGPMGAVAMTINGTQSPTSYDMTMTQTLDGPKGKAKTTIRASGKRLGDCKS